MMSNLKKILISIIFLSIPNLGQCWEAIDLPNLVDLHDGHIRLLSHKSILIITTFDQPLIVRKESGIIWQVNKYPINANLLEKKVNNCMLTILKRQGNLAAAISVPGKALHYGDIENFVGQPRGDVKDFLKKINEKNKYDLFLLIVPNQYVGINYHTTYASPLPFHVRCTSSDSAIVYLYFNIYLINAHTYARLTDNSSEIHVKLNDPRICQMDYLSHKQIFSTLSIITDPLEKAVWDSYAIMFERLSNY